MFLIYIYPLAHFLLSLYFTPSLQTHSAFYTQTAFSPCLQFYTVRFCKSHQPSLNRQLTQTTFVTQIVTFLANISIGSRFLSKLEVPHFREHQLRSRTIQSHSLSSSLQMNQLARFITNRTCLRTVPNNLSDLTNCSRKSYQQNKLAGE